MIMFVLEFRDPTYGNKRIVGMYCTGTEVEHAREEAEGWMTDEQHDRGCFYSITEYEVGKLYL